MSPLLLPVSVIVAYIFGLITAFIFLWAANRRYARTVSDLYSLNEALMRQISKTNIEIKAGQLIDPYLESMGRSDAEEAAIAELKGHSL